MGSIRNRIGLHKRKEEGRWVVVNKETNLQPHPHVYESYAEASAECARLNAAGGYVVRPANETGIQPPNS